MPISWALFILLATLMPGSDVPDKVPLDFDKFFHFFVFAVLSFLMIISFTKQYDYEVIRKNAIPLSLLGCFGYGLLIEAIQVMIPARNFDYIDVLANLAGSFGGVSSFYLVYKI